jgi:hypothetical protein
VLHGTKNTSIHLNVNLPAALGGVAEAKASTAAGESD